MLMITPQAPWFWKQNRMGFLFRPEVMDLVLDVHDSQGNARPLRSAGIPGDSWFRKGCKVQKDAEFVVVLCLKQSKHDGM